MQPVFEMVVLGSGGGPLETDTSGYLVKPYESKWEDGILGLEGGSGMGALASLLETRSTEELFPGWNIPETHNTPVLKAAYVFSFLSCYLITHAHLDHCHSLILLSGSIPPRPSSKGKLALQPPRLPVYATRKTLERLATAYGGELWPELAEWAPERKPYVPRRTNTEKRGSITGENDQMGSGGGVGVIFTPIPVSTVHTQLHPGLPITNRKFHVLHGCTTKGPYDSSAMFFRYDPHFGSVQEPEDSEAHTSVEGVKREFLFFGDVESDWRRKGEEEFDPEGRDRAKAYNIAIWTEAAESWSRGGLAGVFIECSYDSDRPQHLMFGHVCPPAIIYELQRLASLLRPKERPLEGLRIFITHVKDSLVPHPSGRCARDRIMDELRALEENANLGVEFVLVKRGDRILI